MNECGRDAVCECSGPGSCEAPFCEDCHAEVHKPMPPPILRKHVRAPLGAAAAPSAAAAPTKCSLHPGQDLLLACLHAGCRCLLCPVCSHDLSHKAHLVDVLPLEQATQRIQRELSSASAALVPLLTKAEALAADLSARELSLDGEASAVEGSIKASFRALIERVKARRDELLQRVRSSQSVLRCQAAGARALVARGRAVVASVAAASVVSASAAQGAAPAASGSRLLVESVAHELHVDSSLREVVRVLERVSVRGADRTAASFCLDVEGLAKQVASLALLVVPEPLGERCAAVCAVAAR